MNLVFLVSKVPLALLVRKAREVVVVRLVFRVFLAVLVNVDPLETEVSLVLRVLLVPRVLPVSVVLLELLVPKVLPVNLADLVRPVFLVQEV